MTSLSSIVLSANFFQHDIEPHTAGKRGTGIVLLHCVYSIVLKKEKRKGLNRLPLPDVSIRTPSVRFSLDQGCLSLENPFLRFLLSVRFQISTSRYA